MEKDKLESLLIDYIDGRLSEAEQALIERELTSNENARVLHDQLNTVMGAMDRAEDLKPASPLKQRFESMLREEIITERGTSKGRHVFFRPVFYRVAAALALVLAGVSLGYWINKNQQERHELAAIKKEMETTKAMMMVMLENQQSASQRLVGVSVAYKMDNADDEIVQALVKTMNEDRNTNVRLAALEALGKFQRFPHVRQALIKSLATQNDPAVQIELIRLMVEMKEREALKEFERISTDETMLPAVKDEAHAGILKLS